MKKLYSQKAINREELINAEKTLKSISSETTEA
jgi:hypothetical protein